MTVWGGRLVSTALALAAAVGAGCVVVAVTGHSTAPQPALSQVAFGPPAPPAAAVVPAAPALPKALTRSVPTVLDIPALKVRSTILEVGQAADGTVAVPPPGPTYDNAAWYRHSPTPGSLGPAVIVGHVDSAAGGPSVFFRLGELRPADVVNVTRADGSVARFVVDDVRRYRKADFPTALVYGNTPRPELRLITCGGPFDRSSGHYLDNIVVSASLA